MHLFQLNDSLTNKCQFENELFSNNLRLLIVGIIGTTISIISIIENLIVFYVFSTSKKLRRQNYANPLLLAFFDILVSIGYFCTESIHFFAFRFQWIELAVLWAKYMRFAYCIQHFALTVSNFLLVVASIERYLANGPSYAQKRILVFMVQNKAYVIITILILAFMFKATIFLENNYLYLPNCAPIMRLVPIWTSTNWIASLRFWLRKIFTIVLPFFILVYCNFYIVMRLRSQRRNNKYYNTINNNSNSFYQKKISNNNYRNNHNFNTYKKQQKIQQKQQQQQQQKLLNDGGNLSNENLSDSPSPLPLISSSMPSVTTSQQSSTINSNSKFNDVSKKDKRGVRVATRTLVMVVGCYLISNSMTTIINIWEFINPNFLRYKHFYSYYIISDLSVLLTICGCALRFLIYVINDRRIRNAIFRALIRCRFFYKRGSKHNFAGDNFNFEKWSIVVVSNSLRSNITGMLSQVDFATFKGKKSFDQLTVLVQNRRRFLVQMTINLGAVEELEEKEVSTKNFDDDEQTFFTNIHEDYETNYDCLSSTNDQKRLTNSLRRPSAIKSSNLETIVER